jgi:hypothetical protein
MNVGPPLEARPEKRLEWSGITGTLPANCRRNLQTVASMPSENWLKIQAGIAEMFAARFSADEVSAIRDALTEADAEFARGEVLTSTEVRRQLGLA